MFFANTETSFGKRLVRLFLKSLLPLAFLLLIAGFVYTRWADTAKIKRLRNERTQTMSKEYVLSIMENEARFFYAALALAAILAVVVSRSLRRIGRLGDELEGLTTKVLHNQSRAFGDMASEANAIVSNETPPIQAARKIEAICTAERKKIAAYMRLARNFAGYDDSNAEDVNVSEAAWRIVSEMKATIDRLEVRYTPSEEDVIVRAHPFLVFEIIGNLMDNAVKYTESGVVALSVSKQKDTAKIVVSDTGCGISAADRKRMYERFYRAPSASDKPGSGLGLATVYEIVVRRYKGKIDCHSEVGNGTIFTVTLPLAATQGKA